MTTHETNPISISVSKCGQDLIRDPLLNKGSAFSPQERRELGLRGLLPPETNTIVQQQKRIYTAISELERPLEKYVSLTSLQDRNETLFYRVLVDHLESLMPIVYTPTVGLATQNFSQVFRRGRGIWITPDMRGEIAGVLKRASDFKNIRLIVATDNESILGIGDQGAGGMAISIGKLSLYVAGAGIAPNEILPISLDVGTDNPQLLDDELYLGWRQMRLRGKEYDTLINEFVTAVQQVFPQALLQWEDFRKDNALNILDRHRNNILSFNDDIQGTGAVALAGLLSAIRVTGEALQSQRILIYGAGAAGLGIARQIKAAMTEFGLSDREVQQRVAVLDSQGLLVDDREFRDPYKRELAWTAEFAASLGLADSANRDLYAVVTAFQPSMLVGSSGHAQAFTRKVIQSMAANIQRPLVMPFSNPTDRSEAIPEDIIRWTEGRALIATGSPFPNVHYKDTEYQIGQGNNVFVFPGLGLGALLSGATRITDAMISAAANALASSVTDQELSRGLLFPAVSRLREVSREVALAVARQATKENVASISTEKIEDDIDDSMWQPNYPAYTRN